MGVDTARDPFPYDVFVGRGWDYDFEFFGEDLSDVTAARIGLRRRGLPEADQEIVLGPHLRLEYLPPDGEEATGDEPVNGLVVELPPTDNADWSPGFYDFSIALTRGDGSIDTALTGVVEVREAA